MTLAITAPAIAQDVPVKAVSSPAIAGPDLDLSIHHYSRILTAEGVLRESRYEEKMLRRQGHVWVSRVLPESVAADDDHVHRNKTSPVQKIAAQSGIRSDNDGHKHKHFNHVALARHVTRDGDKTRLEFVNFQDREVVSIAPAEYENVNFDGSWANAFFLMDPKSVAALPLSKRASSVTGARWREQKKNGLFQRVLWDDRKLIPLIVETGNLAGNFFERVEVKPQASAVKSFPWQQAKGFAAKEYSDFLD